jgi:hypothetical protein
MLDVSSDLSELVDRSLGLLASAARPSTPSRRAATSRDRVLGKSTTVSCETLTTWFITGNNVALAADTPKRCLHIRLHCEAEKPNQRSGFRYPDLFSVVRERRTTLLSAALTVTPRLFRSRTG